MLGSFYRCSSSAHVCTRTGGSELTHLIFSHREAIGGGGEALGGPPHTQGGGLNFITDTDGVVVGVGWSGGRCAFSQCASKCNPAESQ